MNSRSLHTPLFQTITCDICGIPVGRERCGADRSPVLCDDCLMDKRTVRTRKTHWQYLTSIKGDYLIPPGRKAE